MSNPATKVVQVTMSMEVSGRRTTVADLDEAVKMAKDAMRSSLVQRGYKVARLTATRGYAYAVRRMAAA